MNVKNENDGKKWVEEVLKMVEKVDKFITDEGYTQIDKLIIYHFLYEMHLNLYSRNFKYNREILEKQVNRVVSEMVNNIRVNEKYK
jgi:uncharacterized protein YcaQ